jgi:hypothetical protein
LLLAAANGFCYDQAGSGKRPTRLLLTGVIAMNDRYSTLGSTPLALDAWLCDGLTRRQALRVGGLSAFGLSLPALLAARVARAADTAGAGFARARACIVLWMTGGPPQHETWDPKPDAPAEIRGPFGSIATTVPGLRVGELMPRTAALAHKLCVIRSLVTNNPGHAGGSYELLTGMEHPGGKGNENIKASRTDFPYFGSVVKQLRRPVPGLPTTVVYPQHTFSVVEWPGQNGGFLGSDWDPWLVLSDPGAPDFHLDALSLPADLPPPRLTGRRLLLDRVDVGRDPLSQAAPPTRFGHQVVQAFDLLSGQKVRAAFDLGREAPAVRDRYGRNSFGQGCLLARRLVEAGVALVQVNWRRSAADDPVNENMWDLHKGLATTLKDRLMPVMDLGYTALLEDLEQRGLFSETLVLWLGEMGRTPKLETLPDYREPGRNHWGHVFSMALAGAGIRAGLVHGASDRIGAIPKDKPVGPQNVTATLFHALGIPPQTELRDRLNRPLPISQGRPLTELFG